MRRAPCGRDAGQQTHQRGETLAQHYVDPRRMHRQGRDEHPDQPGAPGPQDEPRETARRRQHDRFA